MGLTTGREGGVPMDTILLVEDNEQIMEINEWYLTQRSYRVEKAYTLAQAREALQSVKPDLIILDVLLPDGDGLAFCGEIRRTRNTPILFLTGMNADKDVMEGFRRGGNDYITKPYDLEMLGVRVEALLSYVRGLRPANQVQTFGPLRFDIIQSEAYVNGEALMLSNKEFRLLYALARRGGETVSRGELSREVWGFETGADIPMLWTAMSRLKKKLLPFSDLLTLDSDHSGYTLVLPRSASPRREARP